MTERQRIDKCQLLLKGLPLFLGHLSSLCGARNPEESYREATRLLIDISELRDEAIKLRDDYERRMNRKRGEAAAKKAGRK